MTAQIRITYPDGRIEDRTLPPGSYVAGREAGDIVLGDPNTSGRHAQIDVQMGRVTITDLNSTNGTYDPQGQRLSGPYVMLPDQPLRLGTTSLMLLPPARTAAGTQVMQQVPSGGGAPPPPAYAPPPTAPYGQPSPPNYGQASQPNYGQPPPQQQYGQPPTAPYGQPPAPPPYGQPPAAPSYGQPPGAGSYGQPPAPAPYGQPPGAPYGQPPGATPYGQPPGGAPYGQPPGTPFGQQSNPYGAPAGGFTGPLPGLVAGGGGTAMAPGSEAEWGKRAVGYLIDYALTVPVITVLMILFTVVSGLFAGAASSVAAASAANPLAAEEATNAALGMFSSSMCAMFAIIPLAILAVGAYNRVYLVSKRGYSIGQGVMKIKVVTGEGALLPMGTAALRLLAQVVISFVPIAGLLDLLWPLWDPHRQTLHDKAVGSFVIPDLSRQ